MPGTGMSLAKFMSLTFWIILAIYIIALATAALYKKWPNPITAAVYKVVTAQ